MRGSKRRIQRWLKHHGAKVRPGLDNSAVKVNRAKIHTHKRYDRQEAQNAQRKYDRIVAPPARHETNMPSVRTLDRTGRGGSQLKSIH